MHAPRLVIPRATVTPDSSLVWSSGFLAVLAITTTMYALPAFGLPQVDLPIWVARLFVADPVAVGAWGLGVHLIAGMSFAWVYVVHVEPRLSVGPAASGTLYGAALWIFAQALAVPALGVLASGVPAAPGVLSWRLGVPAAVASLIAHLSYGLVLGWVYGCRGGGQCRPRP